MELKLQLELELKLRLLAWTVDSSTPGSHIKVPLRPFRVPWRPYALTQIVQFSIYSIFKSKGFDS